jgi:hypothetical protein
MIKKNYLLVSLIAFLSFQCHGSQGSFEKHKTARQLYRDPSFASLLNGSKDNERFCLCPNASLDTRLSLANQVVKDALKHLEKNDTIHITSFGAAGCSLEVLIAQLLKNYGFTNITINAIDPIYNDPKQQFAIWKNVFLNLQLGFITNIFHNASQFSIKPGEKHIFLRIDLSPVHRLTSYKTEEFIPRLHALEKGPLTVVFCPNSQEQDNFLKLDVYSLKPLRICISRTKKSTLTTENIFPQETTYAENVTSYEDILKQIVDYFFRQASSSSKLSVINSECVGHAFFELLSQSKLAFCLEFDMIFNYRTTSNGADFDDLTFDESLETFI